MLCQVLKHEPKNNTGFEEFRHRSSTRDGLEEFLVHLEDIFWRFEEFYLHLDDFCQNNGFPLDGSVLQYQPGPG